MTDQYENHIQKFQKILRGLGFPEIATLPGKYFTFSYTCPVYGNVMLGGRVENIAYRISPVYRSKRQRSGASIELRISTNVTQHFGMCPDEYGASAEWQHGMHTLEFNNKHSDIRRKDMCACWSFIKPKTHAEAQEYWKMTNLEVDDKIKNFRNIILVKKLEKGQVVFW